MEYKRDQFTISDDSTRLDIDAICDFLSRAYWSDKRPRDAIEKSIRFSLNFGVYDDGKQIGFARVVTDRAIFAYLCDVFIHEDYRGHSLGK
jgi:Acetyltransferase (GNAT) family